ncbi:hypothetical protein [Streptomyces sp. NPDC060194]|uniref:hypothetical protein n=1 Tax=Streptomyces sp. NPDC060194 TaxID=3347069 RepID=UPI003669E3B3
MDALRALPGSLTATVDGREDRTGRCSTVGGRAVARWMRPVAYQNVPAHQLPEPLRDAGPVENRQDERR